MDTRALQTDDMDGLETRTDQPAGEEHRAARAVGVLPSEEHRLVHRLVRGVRVHLRQQRNLPPHALRQRKVFFASMNRRWAFSDRSPR